MTSKTSILTEKRESPPGLGGVTRHFGCGMWLRRIRLIANFGFFRSETFDWKDTINEL